MSDDANGNGNAHAATNVPATTPAAPDADTMRAIAPRFSGTWAVKQAAIIDAIGPILGTVLDSGYCINTPLRVAHFLSQCCHESAGFRTLEEFADGSAYEGRRDLGNIHPGDGRRYKGRGLIQLTGRANYLEYSNYLNVNLATNHVGPDIGHVDLVASPEMAAQPDIALHIACLFWVHHALSRYADRDDVVAITRRINGGLNGLADRQALLVRAKKVLGISGA